MISKLKLDKKSIYLLRNNINQHKNIIFIPASSFLKLNHNLVSSGGKLKSYSCRNQMKLFSSGSPYLWQKIKSEEKTTTSSLIESELNKNQVSTHHTPVQKGIL